MYLSLEIRGPDQSSWSWSWSWSWCYNPNGTWMWWHNITWLILQKIKRLLLLDMFRKCTQKCRSSHLNVTFQVVFDSNGWMSCDRYTVGCERTNERNVARVRSDQCGASEWVSGASEWVNGASERACGGANGPELNASISSSFLSSNVV